MVKNCRLSFDIQTRDRKIMSVALRSITRIIYAAPNRTVIVTSDAAASSAELFDYGEGHG